MISIIGNAPVDLIAHVSDSFLQQHGLTKGICTTISEAKQTELLDAVPYDIIPGGCGGNVAASLALLGAPVQFIGSYGDDRYGEVSLNSLKGIGVLCYEKPQSVSTQIVFIFLTEDGDRSFAAFYHDDSYVSTQTLEAFITARPDGPILIDGYKLLYPKYADSMVSFLTDTVHSDVDFVFCPNDLSVITEAEPACETLLNRCTHLVVNHAEARALTDTTTTEAAVAALMAMGKQGVVTCGSQGAHVFEAKRLIQVPSALDPAQFIDSNGAGDGFTAGYVYGLVNGASLEEKGSLGARCAAAVLSTAGARPPLDLRRTILEKRA